MAKPAKSKVPRSPARSLPHSTEDEEKLLCCCLIDGADTIARCLEARLSPEAFFNPANQVIFQKITEIYLRHPPVEFAVLVEELKAARQLDLAGGYRYLTNLQKLSATTAQAGKYLERVRELYVVRKTIGVATRAVEAAMNFTGDIEQLVDEVEQNVMGVRQAGTSSAPKAIGETTREAIKEVEKMVLRHGEPTGVASGFRAIDILTSGFQRQEMIVLAARPSVGKTSLAMNIVDHAAQPPQGPGVAVLFFSLEMSAAQLAMRLISARARVDLKKLREGWIPRTGQEQERLTAAAEQLAAAPIFINDASSLTITQLRAGARRVHAKHKLGLIVVDYLQLISPANKKVPREQQVAESSRGLKALAKELDLPVIVLSQLNRTSEVDERQPRLSDLRESGAIEQDADVVMLLARAGDFGDVILAKQRNGQIGEAKLKFLSQYTSFEAC